MKSFIHNQLKKPTRKSEQCEYKIRMNEIKGVHERTCDRERERERVRERVRERERGEIELAR
jgi:hypothetical protein